MGGVHAGNIVSAGTSTMLSGIFYSIKNLLMPPPKKLEWWETDEFKTVVGFIILLTPPILALLGLKWCLKWCLQTLLRKLRK